MNTALNWYLSDAIYMSQGTLNTNRREQYLRTSQLDDTDTSKCTFSSVYLMWKLP